MRQRYFSAIEAIRDTGKNSHPRRAPKSSLFPMSWKDDIRPIWQKIKELFVLILFLVLVWFLWNNGIGNAHGQINYVAPVVRVVRVVGCG